jgi:drug/metabolite transporter (DMT)-like permease
MITWFKYTIPDGVRYMFMSAFGFALMAACVKLVSKYGIPVLEIVAARAVVSGGISYVDIKRKKISPWGNNKPLLIARGTVGVVALFFVYSAVINLPLAEATILQYLHPVFTAVLAIFFLKEVVHRSTISCIIFSLFGLLVMVAPNFYESDITYSWFSIGAGILGAFGSAIAYIIVKKLTKTEDSSVIVFYFPLISLPIAIVLLGNDFVVPSINALGLLILIGIFTQVGQIFLTKALHCDDANKVTAYAYVQVIFSLLIGWIIFDEITSLTTLLGGALILIGAMLNIFWKK